MYGFDFYSQRVIRDTEKNKKGKLKQCIYHLFPGDLVQLKYLVFIKLLLLATVMRLFPTHLILLKSTKEPFNPTKVLLC